MADIIEVSDLQIPGLQLYAGRRESGLKHACEPAPGYFIAESIKVIARALEAGYAPVSFLCSRKYAEEILHLMQDARYGQAAARNVPETPVYTASESVLEEIAGYHMTGGALALMRRKEHVPAEKLFYGEAELRADHADPIRKTADKAPEIRRIAVLEHVVNPTNLGAIVRSAAALGMDAVLFTPDCADPLYRRAIRVSMGTIFQIPWTFTGENPEEWYRSGVQQLKNYGFHTVAMALQEHAKVPDDPSFRQYEKLAVIVGTEGEGLAEETIRQCDDTVMIPMTHGVDSLNVGAAAAVAFWNFGTLHR